MMNGVLCVMTHLKTHKPLWPVDNWDTMIIVTMIICQCKSASYIVVESIISSSKRRIKSSDKKLFFVVRIFEPVTEIDT